MVRGVSQRVSIDVERGAADGHQIRISGGGDEHPSYKTGDLIFRVAAAAHPRFRRDGNDLWVHHAITLRESLLGFDAQLVHLDGHTVRLRSDRVSAPHTLMRIAGLRRDARAQLPERRSEALSLCPRASHTKLSRVSSGAL